MSNEKGSAQKTLSVLEDANASQAEKLSALAMIANDLSSASNETLQQYARLPALLSTINKLLPNIQQNLFDDIKEKTTEQYQGKLTQAARDVAIYTFSMTCLVALSASYSPLLDQCLKLNFYQNLLDNSLILLAVTVSTLALAILGGQTWAASATGQLTHAILAPLNLLKSLMVDHAWPLLLSACEKLLQLSGSMMLTLYFNSSVGQAALTNIVQTKTMKASAFLPLLKDPSQPERNLLSDLDGTATSERWLTTLSQLQLAISIAPLVMQKIPPTQMEILLKSVIDNDEQQIAYFLQQHHSLWTLLIRLSERMKSGQITAYENTYQRLHLVLTTTEKNNMPCTVNAEQQHILQATSEALIQHDMGLDLAIARASLWNESARRKHALTSSLHAEKTPVAGRAPLDNSF